MHDYGVNDYGLILNEETMKHIASVMCDDFTEEAYDEDDWAFKDEITDKLCVYISEFTGEAVRIDDHGNDDYLFVDNMEDRFSNDTIFYVPVDKCPGLFSAPYQNIGEIIDEMKEKAGKYLPPDYDYRDYIRHIVGTYFG